VISLIIQFYFFFFILLTTYIIPYIYFFSFSKKKNHHDDTIKFDFLTTIYSCTFYGYTYGYNKSISIRWRSIPIL
jgi:hypothetical protein